MREECVRSDETATPRINLVPSWLERVVGLCFRSLYVYMIITQKKMFHKITFDFQDEYVLYTIVGDSTKRTMQFTYDELFVEEKHITYFSTWNEYFRNLGVLRLVLWVIESLGQWRQLGNSIRLRFWVGCLIRYYITYIRYIELNLRSGKMLLLQDGKEWEILALFAQRRKEYIRKTQWVIDPTNRVDWEKDRFNSLANKDIITQEELEDFIQEIEKLCVPVPNKDE
jgi:hypothetical protein